MLKKITGIILSLVVIFYCMAGAFAEVTFSSYDLSGAPGERMKSMPVLKKKYDTDAQVILNEVRWVEQNVTNPNAYGWAEIWLFRTNSDYVRATSTSGNDNKASVANGSTGKLIPYRGSSYVQIGGSYRLAMRVPDAGYSGTFRFKGKWSPDNNLG